MRATVTIDQIDAWLPQTQCTQCGYPCCRAYAEALAAGSADINQCPPGGDVTIQALATLLHLPPKPLDPQFGRHKPRARAVIDETLCIGCRKCIDACPVEAIVGARKLMHTVIDRECTGCELCLPPCPVDCIAMVPNLTGHARSASGSPPNEGSRAPARSARSLLPLGEGMGMRGDDPPHPLPSPGGRGEVGENLHFDRNGGEGTRSSLDFSRDRLRLGPIDDPWPEYARTETDHWRQRTERRVQRLARTKRSRRTKTSANPPTAPDRDRIRAQIRAAVSRVRAKKQRASGSGSSSA